MLLLNNKTSWNSFTDSSSILDKKMIFHHCMIISILQAVMHESFKDLIIYLSAEVIPKVF